MILFLDAFIYGVFNMPAKKVQVRHIKRNAAADTVFMQKGFGKRTERKHGN